MAFILNSGKLALVRFKTDSYPGFGIFHQSPTQQRCFLNEAVTNF